MHNVIKFRQADVTPKHSYNLYQKIRQSNNDGQLIVPKFGQSDKSAWVETTKRYREQQWSKGKSLKNDKQRCQSKTSNY